MAGIALKGQADLISIMFPLEVLVQLEERKKREQKSTVVFFGTNTVYKTKHGWEK